MRQSPRTVSPVLIAALAIGVVGVGGAAFALQASRTPAGSASPTATPASSSAIAGESSAPSGSPGASGASPSGSAAAPSPSPTSAAPATWHEPALALTGKECGGLVATVDGQGHTHVAAQCGMNVVYSAEGADGKWTQKLFPHPSHRLDTGPVLAADGNVIYLAFTREVQLEGGCGDSGLQDLGVYVMHRQLPNGNWTSPVQIGVVKDQVIGFRVVSGVLHLAVAADNGRTYYEIKKSGRLSRYVIPGAAGGVSLRVGSDGRARMAFEATDGIRYGTFTGKGISATRIPGSTSLSSVAPLLVLGAGNQPYVLWTRTTAYGVGCAEPEPGPKDGTYFATRVGAVWTARRITTSTDEKTMTLDTRTGEVHVLVGGNPFHYYVRSKAGVWHATTLGYSGSGAVIRTDTTTGRIFVVYELDDYNANVSRIFSVSKY
jgi:hypothetical protein